MSKKRTVRKVSDNKRGRPFIRFNFWMLVIIFGLSFLGCFILYMLAANVSDNFFDEEFSVSSVSESESPIDTSTTLAEISESDSTETTVTTSAPVKTVVNPVPESAKADASYFDDVWLLTDPTLLNIKQNTSIKNVLGNDALNAMNVNTHKIESVYGTITAFQNLQIINPKAVYIMLGADLSTSSADEMINSYSSLISNMLISMPDTKIYIMQLPPIYTDSETLSNEKINDYNSKLLQLANNHSVYCIDTNTILKNNGGTLDEQYYSAEENTLSSTAYSTIYDYILTHTAQ